MPPMNWWLLDCLYVSNNNKRNQDNNLKMF